MTTPPMTRHRKRVSLCIASVALLALFVLAPTLHADDYKVIPLDTSTGAAPAPGSDNAKRHERDITDPRSKQRWVVNVVNPTLTLVQPPADKANGSAVVICPGGGFAILSIDSEGLDVAKFLAAQGVTCFVLKYRLMETKTNQPLVELFTRKDLNDAIANGFKNAAPDGLAAVQYVREHAKDYAIDPKRIGIIGFSAGGMVTVATALRGEGSSRPDFAASIYGAYDLAKFGDKVSAGAPPMFVVVAEDDPLKLAPSCVTLYQAWAAAHNKAELHVYTKGGHGFGMNKRGLPIDTWADRYVDWLTLLNVIKK
jgi:acetyl esterase/lipase